jgi:hypothetical protein
MRLGRSICHSEAEVRALDAAPASHLIFPQSLPISWPPNLRLRCDLNKGGQRGGSHGCLADQVPHTDRPISTGIELDVETFGQLPDVLSHVKCRECGLEHAWWTREAWLQEAAEVSPPKDEAA